MKNVRSGRHSRHRNHMPAVICLPAPKPPAPKSTATAPRQEPEVARAIALTAEPEALVHNKHSSETQVQFETRQMRRQARRAEMKANRRGTGSLQSVKVRMPELEVEPEPPILAPLGAAEPHPPILTQQVIAEPQAVAPEMPEVQTMAEEPLAATHAEKAAPLPRNRSLTTRPRGLRAIGHWVRSFVMIPPRKRATPEQAVAQIKAMRIEIARMQRTLDKMLGGAAA